jgi:hypothetical protein
MKKYLLVTFLIAAAGLSTASAQVSRSFTAPAGKRAERVQRRAPQPVRRGEIGAFPRAARAGNPIQLINPRAPARYFGPPQDTVTWEPYFNRERYSGNQITGLILFGIAW